MMEFFASPALVGWIIACAALSAWTLGRWQSGAVPFTDAGCPVPAAPLPPPELRAADCPDPGSARTDRRVELDWGFSLGELHAEVSAYRRHQQVFAAVAREGLRLDPIAIAALPDCRYTGPIAQPSGAWAFAAPSEGGCPQCAAAPDRPSTDGAAQPSDAVLILV